MDQAEATTAALRRLDRLVGEWTLQATPPGGDPWPGSATSVFEWHSSGAHLVQRTEIEMPEAPNSVSIIGCDGATGEYYQLYSDDRGICRIYRMSLTDTEWRLWRDAEPFAQRFLATITAEADTITGRWEYAEDGGDYRTDFDLVYRRNNA